MLPNNPGANKLNSVAKEDPSVDLTRFREGSQQGRETRLDYNAKNLAFVRQHDLATVKACLTFVWRSSMVLLAEVWSVHIIKEQKAYTLAAHFITVASLGLLQPRSEICRTEQAFKAGRDQGHGGPAAICSN